VPRRGPEAGDPPEIAWFNDFHGLGANTLFMPVSTERAMSPWLIDEYEKREQDFFSGSSND